MRGTDVNDGSLPMIPVMHCFDDRYAAPAAVAFLSMLEHASPAFSYALHVVHEDISQEHQRMLHAVVGQFPNATLEFHASPKSMGALFDSMSTRGHYSKEVLYKMVVPDLFPQYRTMVVTDVDVLYQDDISESFVRFLSNGEGGGHWIAGVGYHGAELPCRWIDGVFENCYGVGDFTADERHRLMNGVGGGYLICNLELMRRDGVSRKMLDTFRAYAPRLKQAEQDVINLACAGRTLRLPIRNMVSTCFYDHLSSDEAPYWRETLAKPVQLHYASEVKPWNSPGSTKAHLWWSCLCRTPFYYEVASRFDAKEKRSQFRLLGMPFLKVWHTGAISRVKAFNHLRLSESGT